MVTTRQFIAVAFSLVCVVAALTSCTPSTEISFKDPRIKYMGRIGMKQDAAELIWTASSVNVNFEGTGASAKLSATKGADIITVVVDGKVVNTIQPKKNKEKNYELVSGLAKGPHRLQVFKRTEYEMGSIRFYNLQLADNGKLLPPPVYKHRMEFYGNSITSGYALEDPDKKDRGYPEFENGYRAYANATARHFNSEIHCISKSGIGVTISWFPYTMPEIYDRVYPENPASHWDFTKFTPEIVLVNLGQNDHFLIANPQHKEFKHRFGNKPPTAEFIIGKYKDFITSLRAKYPRAKIICSIGNMDANEPGAAFPGYILCAVKQMNDKDVYTCFFPFMGQHRHPDAAEQQAMTRQLIAFIHNKFGW